MRKTGYTTNGASTRSRTMAAKAAYWCRTAGAASGAALVASTYSVAMLLGAAEEPGGLHQQDQCHDDEDHGVRGLGIEDLGQPLDHAEPEAGDDRAHDRSHPADHHDREHHDDQI